MNERYFHMIVCQQKPISCQGFTRMGGLFPCWSSSGPDDPQEGLAPYHEVLFLSVDWRQDFWLAWRPRGCAQVLYQLPPCDQPTSCSVCSPPCSASRSLLAWAQSRSTRDSIFSSRQSLSLPPARWRSFGWSLPLPLFLLSQVGQGYVCADCDTLFPSQRCQLRNPKTLRNMLWRWDCANAGRPPARQHCLPPQPLRPVPWLLPPEPREARLPHRCL